jgi:hypothetical protein
MSDSSSTQLYYYPESAWGQIPAGSPLPKLREFRFTNESLTQTTDTTQSEEIRSDRQVSDIVRTKVGASGDVGVELSYGSHDDLLEGAFSNTWSTVVNLVGIALTFASDSPNRTGTISAGASPTIGSPAPFVNVQVGQFIRITSGANAGFYKVQAKVDADTLRVYTPTPFSSTTYKTTLKGAMLKTGTTRKSFVIEKFFSDLSPEQRMIFSGMRVGNLQLKIAPGSIVNGSLSFMGKQALAQSATVGDGVPLAASTANVMNAVDNITDILIDNQSAGAGVYFTEVGFTVDNTLREQGAIGSLANIGIGLGRFNITGNIKAYFENRALLDRYLNFTELGLSFRAVDGAGNSYVYDFPAIKFTKGDVVAGGNDQDVMVALEFMAKRNSAMGAMAALSRIPA